MDNHNLNTPENVRLFSSVDGRREGLNIALWFLSPPLATMVSDDLA